MKTLYKCSICGTITRQRLMYGSLSHEDTCPALMPYACGFGCQMKIDRKIKSGEWKVPKLRASAHHQNISKCQIGYDPQPSQDDLIGQLLPANATVEPPRERKADDRLAPTACSRVVCDSVKSGECDGCVLAVPADHGKRYPLKYGWCWHREINVRLNPANAGGMARELAAQDSESITDLNG